MTILHKNLAGNQLHESKGLSASNNKEYNFATSGANDWGTIIEVQSGTASASTEIDIASLSGYTTLILTFQDLKLSTTANLEFLVSSDNGSTFNTTGIYYAGYNQNGTSNMQTHHTSIYLTENANSNYYTGKIVVANFNKAVPTSLYGHAAQTSGSNFTTAITNFSFRGFINSATAWNAFRVWPTSGNLTSGKIIVEGIKG